MRSVGTRLLFVVLALVFGGCGKALLMSAEVLRLPGAVQRLAAELRHGRSGQPIELPDEHVASAFTSQLEHDLGENSVVEAVWLSDASDLDEEPFRALLGMRRDDGCYLDEAWIERGEDGRYRIERYGETVRIHCRFLSF